MKPSFLIFALFYLPSLLFAQPRLGESQINQPERRMAIVIGMNDYKYVRPLKNPTNDAVDMTTALEDLGFTVTTLKNQTHGQINAAINKFLTTLRANDVVMFYFSGHGIGYLDDNYLLPTDARIECLEQITAYTLSVKRITADIQGKKVRNCFVILDACRSLGNLYACNDNKGSRDIISNKGFIIPQNQPRGSIIVYATQAGQTAEDNQKKRNGLFTQELLKNIAIPDLTFGTILTKTALAVVEESQKTNNYQEPTIYGLIGTEFVFISTNKEKEDNRINSKTIEELFEQAKKLYLEKKYTDCFPLYKQIAELGDEDGQILLGDMYIEGLGVLQDYSEALKWFKKAAEKGNAAGQNNTGFMYEKGLGVEQDFLEARKWFTKAAEKGDAMGQYNLGLNYRKGLGVAKDFAEAIKWFIKAAEQGHASSQFNLGYMYQKGQGVTRDYVEAVKWFRKAAEQGNPDGETNLGFMLEKGFGVKQDYTEAIKWYEKAASKGYSEAQYNLGLMYEYGMGVPVNLTLATSWYEKSSSQNFELAIDKLASLKVTKADYVPWIPPDIMLIREAKALFQNKFYTNALEKYKLAAEMGNSDAQKVIGDIYSLGLGVSVNYSEAFKFYSEAASKGNKDSYYSLGVLFERGWGTTKSYKEALKYYTLSAQNLNSDALCSLGSFYFGGKGVTKNYNEAFKLFTKSADLGNFNAVVKLGGMYETGSGMSKNLIKAYELYKIAADKGNKNGQYNFGRIYEYGKGVAPDINYAIYWYKLAANQKNELAIKRISELKKKGYLVNN